MTKNNISRILLIFSLAFVILFGSSSSNQTDNIDDNSEVTSGGWLIYHLLSEPATLNPITATDVYESTINSRFVYETLTTRDTKTLEIVPLLAQSWEISDDKLKYRFKLRKDVKWQDGVPFTSEDVVFSYKSIMDPKVDAPHLRSYYQEILDVKAIDEHSVEFTYSRPYFLALEFCGGMPIVPKHLFNKGDFNRNPYGRKPVGTGPYKFVKWQTGREIVLERNQGYWGKTPDLERIVFKIINDRTVAFQVLKRGDLDFSGLTPIQWDRQSNTKVFKRNFNKYKYFRPNYSFIGWNMNRPYFSDKRVRTAMTHLLDRELILDKILLNLGAIVTNPFYINSPEYNKSIQQLKFDSEKARELLKEAGWVDHDNDGIRDKDGVKFEFEFLLPSGSETGEKIATILKEELDKVGIVMNIRKTEWAVLTTRLNERKFDAVTLGWSMGIESDPYQIWNSTQAESGSNFVGFKNKRADELINRARQEFDRNKRTLLYREFSEIVHNEQPYTFLFCNMSTVAVNKRFRNVVLYPLGLDVLEWYVPKPLRKY